MAKITGHFSNVTVDSRDMVSISIEAHEQPMVMVGEWNGLGLPALVLYWTGYYCTVYRETVGGALYLFKGVISDEKIEAQIPDPFLGEEAMMILQRVGVICGRYRETDDGQVEPNDEH